MDRLVDFFKHKIEDFGLVDIEPIKHMPTWRNNQSFKDGVLKR
jgi:hypothetical protein